MNAYTEIDNDGIAKAARVTLGLFYAYLGSENCAFEVVLLVGFDEETCATFKFKYIKQLLMSFYEYCLSQSHRDGHSNNYAIIILSTEGELTTANVVVCFKTTDKIAISIKNTIINIADKIKPPNVL
jgi:hypothetical protein